jgi:hypothetical protein
MPPRRGVDSSPGHELLGANTPMGPPENRTRRSGRQARVGPKRPARRPRTRLCLLKGCEEGFPPRHARQRYCSDQCRQAARTWSRWKAQQSYRATAAGKEKRKEQSRRYRERIRKRKQPPPREAIAESARVISQSFFRHLLRPARLLSGHHSSAAMAQATLLLTRMPARFGTRLATRAALAPGSAAQMEDRR